MTNRPKDPPLITLQQVRSLFSYDAETGHLTWVNVTAPSQKHLLGKIAGSLDMKGRRVVSIMYRNYFVSRLVWLHVHGTWPPAQIDHINRDPSDNRLCNLRPATAVQNMANRKVKAKSASGFRGVFFDADRGLWRASIRVSGKRVFIGRFSTPEAAGDAYRDEKVRLHGEFALLD